MNTKGIDWAAVHASRRLTPLTPLLAAGATLYRVAVCLHRLIYAVGLAKARRLPGFVLSVGNLTAGGTGKTPAVAWLARWARDQGYAVCVLSRGYGRVKGAECVVVSDGRELNADPMEAGDEPCLLARALPGVPVVVGADRWQAGHLAHKRFGSSFFILDDGFQHRRLKRDFDLVLLDARSPFGNGHLLPWGPLREPVRQVRRADAFVLTGCGREEGREEASCRALRLKAPGTPVFRSEPLVEALVLPGKGDAASAAALRDEAVLAFAGIASPGRFRETLRSLGAELTGFRVFPDHHRYTGADLRSLFRERAATGARYLITTEKDWVKLESLVTQADPIGYLRIRFQILYQERDFFRIVEEKTKK